MKKIYNVSVVNVTNCLDDKQFTNKAKAIRYFNYLKNNSVHKEIDCTRSYLDDDGEVIDNAKYCMETLEYFKRKY